MTRRKDCRDGHYSDGYGRCPTCGVQLCGALSPSHPIVGCLLPAGHGGLLHRNPFGRSPKWPGKRFAARTWIADGMGR